MKKSVYISLLFLNLAFLGGCSSIVDKAKKVKLVLFKVGITTLLQLSR
jgi:hypothetical protein